MMPFDSRGDRGLTLIIVLMLVALLMAVSVALATRVRLDTRGHAAFRTSPRNFALAEAGVNEAIAQFRDIFLSGNVPAGSSASHSGDYALQPVSLGGQPIRYQLSEPVTNPTSRQLPLGVIPFGGLNVVQYNYSVSSGTPDLVNPSVQLRSQFQVNNIPVFQFLAFYNGRLEILPGANMTLHGRVHTNSDLYLDSSGRTLLISDNPPSVSTVQVSAVGNLYRGRYDNATCSGTVTIDMLQDAQAPHPNLDPLTLNCSGGTRQVPSGEIANWLGSIRANVPNIGIPAGYSTARPAGDYFRNADLRIVLDLTTTYSQARGAGSVPLYAIVVQDENGNVDNGKTAILRNFTGSRPGSIFYTDVPVTANNGATPCTTQGAASSHINPNYTSPGAPCDVAGVADYRRYNPPFQLGTGSSSANAFVYREADLNGAANNRDANWSLSANATRDQTGNGAGIGDYRRGGFYNNREEKWMYLLNVDLQDLLAWNRAQAAGNQLFPPNNTTNGGTVIFLSVAGPLAAGLNNYGVRVLDSPNLGYALNGSDPTGITVASDQAIYVEGNYNSFAAPTGVGPTGTAWTHAPTALIGDSLNVLSQNWEGTLNSRKNDQKSADALASGSRKGASTAVYAAFAVGVSATVAGTYNGGLENYPRFHEDWGGTTLTYRGSLVSLSTPLHVDGIWAGTGNTYNIYNPPTRDWDYDVQFDDVAMLPPMTPTFVSVQQIVISEDFR